MFINPGGPGQSGYDFVANEERSESFDRLWGDGRFDAARHSLIMPPLVSGSFAAYLAQLAEPETDIFRAPSPQSPSTRRAAGDADG
jgi:hypothetical protein